MKQHLKMTCDSRKIDETYVKINGKWHYLYRATDKHGGTLDWVLSNQRNKKAAKRFKSTKSKSRCRQWYQSFSTARNTLDGMEAMRMLKKGHVSNIGKNVAKQNSFVLSVFAIAA